jgi:hypothetical protein
MISTLEREYFRARWPDSRVPDASPLWLLYEIDRAADRCTRMVEIFPDGAITRNSIELEERNRDSCPSLFDDSLTDFLSHTGLETINREQFEAFWTKGVDTPFWFAG